MIMPVDETNVEELDIDNEDFGGGEEDLFSAIRDLAREDAELDSEDDSEDADIEEETDETDLDDADEEDEEDAEEEDEDSEDDVEEDESTKKVQSKEDNAKFAAQRREQEVQKRVQAELERLKQESPEYKVAQQLSKMYGRPVEQIMQELEEAELQKQAEEEQVPVERLRKERDAIKEAEQLRQELNQVKFQNWQNQINSETTRLLGEYNMLSQEDVDQAVNYILNTAKNVDLPLEDAVFAVHGKKIVQSLGKQQVQNDLAKQSGRVKKTPLAPNNGTPSKSTSLTNEEKYIAKQFGMTVDEYIKFKG